MHNSRRLRSTLLVVIALGSSGCAYYNGIYNAKEAAHRAEIALRQGQEGQSHAKFQESAEAAETVLVRFPKSRWRTRALYLAGRGEALGSDCEMGVTRLRQYLAIPGESTGDRDRARLALSICDVVHRRLPVARARLDSLVNVKDAETARQARLWLRAPRLLTTIVRRRRIFSQRSMQLPFNGNS